MYQVKGNCNICGDSNLQILKCSGAHEHLLIVCGECYMIYTHPDLKQENEWMNWTYDTPYCPYEDGKIDLRTPQWASIEEIKQAGWSDFIRN